MHFYIQRLALFSSEVSLCSRWWLTQKLTTGKCAKDMCLWSEPHLGQPCHLVGRAGRKTERSRGSVGPGEATRGRKGLMRLTRPGPGPSLREVRAGAEADVTEELCSLPQACPRGAQESGSSAAHGGRAVVFSNCNGDNQCLTDTTLGQAD